MKGLTTPDWFAVITDLIYAKVSMRDVSRRLDLRTQESLLRHYRAGGQPTYFRGEALVKLWCETLGKTPDELPRKPYIKGHRVESARRSRA